MDKPKVDWQWNTSHERDVLSFSLSSETFFLIIIFSQQLKLGTRRVPGEGNAAHSSILAWRIPSTDESGGLPSTGLQELDTTE